MSKIMELAHEYANDRKEGVSISVWMKSKDALQAEITRMEAEELKLHASLAESVLHAQAGWARYENANNMAKGYQTELAELRAKLAALDAQEPFWHAVVSKQCPVVDKAMRRRDVAEEYADQCRPHYSGVEVVALYLATGAKEKPTEQGCPGYGNHAPGDKPCNICGFVGRKP